MYPSLLAWILTGLIAGWLSGRLIRGGGFGLLADLFLGLVGGVIGGWLFGLIGIRAYGFVGGVATATVGSILLVSLARLFARGD
jgi:uncharacterized membrane protein YeaQ/YmgE (transglycosylase-associated protein family)